MTTEILIVAGEVSGDMHAARVARALKSLRQDLHLFGMGGSSLRSAGVETIIDSEKDASVMGFLEVATKLNTILAAFNKLCSEAKQRKPALAILTDFPDFNLRLAERLHSFGIPVMYYISPQVWAWRRGRIKQIKKYVTTMVPILPFEEDFYRLHGVNAEYLGHPLLDDFIKKGSADSFDRDVFLNKNGLNPKEPVLAILPGSRKIEITRILPTMLEAFEKMTQEVPTLQALIPLAAGLERSFVEGFIDNKKIIVIDQQADAVLKAADATLVTSGTACLEAALVGAPFVVVYKATPLSYFIGRLLVRHIKWFSLPNLIAGEEVVTELLQKAASPERIAATLLPYLTDPQAVKVFKEKIQIVKDRLTVRDSSETSAERTAKLALELLK